MKKILIHGRGMPSFWRKSLMLMKLTILFFMIGLMHVSASVYSQSTKLTLEMRNKKVVDVLDEIENQSEFRFAYSPELIDVNRKVSVALSQKNIEETLDVLFDGTSVTYVLHDRHIMLFPDEMNGDKSVADQQNAVSGKVSDENGMPLPGATVFIKGTTNGTVTNQDGEFYLSEVKPENTIVFSFVGMLSQEIVVGTQKQINVQMVADAIGIEEVIAVGYGSLQKKELTSAVTSISSKDLLQGSFNSPVQMLDGKVAGVSISNVASADPNRSADIQVRGASSIDAGNGPLIIIDGMPGGDLRNIAQQDIESMTVLKDGAAAAIYGSRAANGVIIVKTKQGKSGDVIVTYDSYIDHDVVAKKPDILSPDEFLSHEIDVDRGARTDWYDELINKDNFGQNHFISAAGGTENTIFRVSVNYRDSRLSILHRNDKKQDYVPVSNRLLLMDFLNFQVIYLTKMLMKIIPTMVYFSKQ